MLQESFCENEARPSPEPLDGSRDSVPLVVEPHLPQGSYYQ